MANASIDTDQVAQTIREHLGGRRAELMMGAWNFIHGDTDNLPWLSMRIKGSRRGNYLKITLTGEDLYRVTVGFIRGTSYTFRSEMGGVGAEGLRNSVETLTELRLSLGTMGGQ